MPPRQVGETVIGWSQIRSGLGEVTTFGRDLENDVDAFPLVVDLVGEPSPAPAVGLDHGAAASLDEAADVREMLVDAGVFDVRVEDDHEFVCPHASITSLWTRSLRIRGPVRTGQGFD